MVFETGCSCTEVVASMHIIFQTDDKNIFNTKISTYWTDNVYFLISRQSFIGFTNIYSIRLKFKILINKNIMASYFWNKKNHIKLIFHVK
jgi:hypothetical protein